MITFTEKRHHPFSLTACLLAMVLMVAFGCKAKTEDPKPESTLETKIFGLAPLNTLGAIVEIRGFQDNAPVSSTTTDATGHYELGLGSLSGDVFIKVCGGSYVDMATGAHTDTGEECLHAIATDVQVCETREVNIGPFSEILYSYARAKGIKGASLLRSHLEHWTGGDDSLTRSAAFAEPKAMEIDSAREINPQVMSYLILGGVSRLAQDISDRIGLHSGSILSTIKLAKLLSEDISDGSIDGFKDGRRLMIDGSHELPSSLLRQELAQSIRWFTASDRNQSGIGCEDILGVLSRISSDNLPALGPDGTFLDQEPPHIVLAGITEGAILVSSSSLSCRARDATGVSDMFLSVREIDSEQLVSENKNVPGHAGRREEEAFLELDARKLTTGKYRFLCISKDIWGNKGESSLSFFVNRGDTMLGVSLDPPLVNSEDVVNGGRTIQCNFDDPHVVEIQAIVDGPTRRTDFATVQGRRAASYQWDTSADLDGMYTVSCLAWTTGHTEPRSTSIRVRVGNHPQGIAAGRIFLGSSLSGMEISAFKWGSSGKSDQIGGPVRVVDEDGTFRLPVSNEYQGPILLEASVSPAEEQLTMESIVFSGHRQEIDRKFTLSLLLGSYSPGQRIETLSINAATTLAMSLAQGKLERNLDMNIIEGIQSSNEAIGQYISLGGNLDIGTTQVPDMTRHIEGVGSERIALGLFHAGLSSMAAEECRNNHHNRDASTIADIIACLRDDILSGELNGRNREDRVTQTRFSEGGPNMLRCQLAKSVYSWLQMSDDGHPMLNRTGMSHRDAIESGWLQGISLSRSVLFGDAAVMPFDSEGPEIITTCFAANGAEVDCAQTRREPVLLRVVARDIVGVDMTSVEFDGARLRPHDGGTAELSHYDIPVEDGVRENRSAFIHSRDRMGNVSEREVIFVFDRQAVALAGIQRHYFTNQRNKTISASASSEIIRLTMQGYKISGDGTRIETYSQDIPASLRFEIPVVLPEEDGQYRVAVVAEDVIGNTGEAIIYISKLRQDVSIGMSDIHIGGRVHDRNTVEKVVFGETRQIDVYDVDLDPWHWDEGKLGWPHWSIWGIQGDDIVGNRAQEPASAWYRYKLVNKGVVTEGSWKSLPLESGGSPRFLVEMNYLTILSSLRNADVEDISHEGNISYGASSDAIHTLDIRVSDVYGNTAERNWEFSLCVEPPPVYVWFNRRQPNFGEDCREFTQNILTHDGISDISADISWFGGERNEINSRAFSRSLLPALSSVCISMDDIVQHWKNYRIDEIRAGANFLVHYSNFHANRSPVEIGRGDYSFDLKTVKTWQRHPNPVDVDFFVALQSNQASWISRTFATPGEGFELIPKQWTRGGQWRPTETDMWKAERHRHGKWHWNIRAEATTRGQTVPRIRPNPRSIEYVYGSFWKNDSDINYGYVDVYGDHNAGRKPRVYDWLEPLPYGG